jgi:hypothetical protein
MGAYMIFKLKCDAVDMKTRVIDIQNRYDDKYIDVTLKSVGCVHCHTNVADMTLRNVSESAEDVCIDITVDIDVDVDVESREDIEEVFRRIAKTKPFNELEVVMAYDESWDD